MEEGEVHASIVAMGYETWMGGEVLSAAVFEDEQSVFCQQGECCVGYVCKVLEGVGRVGKDDVVMFLARVYIFKYVSLQRQPFLHLQFLLHPHEELPMFEVFLNGHHLAASTRGQFQADGTCASEEVEGCGGCLEIYIDILQNVEQPFLGKIRRGTCLEACGGGNVPSLVFSSNDAQFESLAFSV